MKKRILIVEDEKPLANALVLKFEHVGFEALAVDDGVKAINELANKKYDLILLDLIMPNMDGFSFMEKIRKAGISTPVIVSTNLSQKEDSDRAKSLGAVDFFVKSDMSITDVIEKINKILE